MSDIKWKRERTWNPFISKSVINEKDVQLQASLNSQDKQKFKDRGGHRGGQTGVPQPIQLALLNSS